MLPKPTKLTGILIVILILIFILFSATMTISQAEETEEESKVVIHFFYLEGCPECQAQEEFMEEEIIGEYSYVEVHKHDVQKEESVELLEELAEKYDVDNLRYVVPTTFVDGEIFQGFNEAKGEEMIEIIEGKKDTGADSLQVPFIGEIEVESVSLFFLAVVLGSVDGLNVCSIGALLMVLMIVLKFDSRKKTFFYGSIFILTVVSVYGLLIFVWYHLLSVIIPHIGFLRYLIAAAGIIGGVVFLKQFLEFYKHGPHCSRSDAGIITKARLKVKETFQDSYTGPVFLIASVIFFAAVVTLIELPCSAALPVAFSGILVDAQIGGSAYAFYVVIYLFFYMLIELVIFAGAVVSKEIWFGSEQAVTWVALLGSIMLFVLGFSYLFGYGI